MSNLGANIKKARLKLGMSAETLAELTNIAPSTIYRYESGDIKSLKTDRLRLIADVLHTTPADLLDVPENPEDWNQRPQFGSSLGDTSIYARSLASYSELSGMFEVWQLFKDRDFRFLASVYKAMDPGERAQLIGIIKGAWSKYNDLYDKEDI